MTPSIVTQFKGKIDGVSLNGAEWLSLLYLLKENNETYATILSKCQQWIAEQHLKLDEMPLISSDSQLDYAINKGLATLKRLQQQNRN